ncbi:sensor histidine kinase [Paenibacillus psychroresistens]|nr:sensor histidine kinase [Paenibacillus psychroresistens]
MKSRSFYLSLKYKIFILFYVFIFAITLIFGYYSYWISKKEVINRVSESNIGVTRQINNNLEYLQKNISDLVTFMSIDPFIQNLLVSNETEDKLPSVTFESLNGSSQLIVNLIITTKNLDFISLYGNTDIPLYSVFSDGSSDPGSFSTIRNSDLYQQALALKGAPLWFKLPEKTNLFIQNNIAPKLGMAKIIRNINTGETIGFIVAGINETNLQNLYLKDLVKSEESVIIVDQAGTLMTGMGEDIYSKAAKNPPFQDVLKNEAEGYSILTIQGKQALVSYSANNNLGWKVLYSVPILSLTKDINSIKTVIIFIIIVCLLLSIPLMFLLSFYLTLPLKNLLSSMKRFQKGNFLERIEIRNRDEIGDLSRGYNSMVANIKQLIDDSYILQIKEKEAEFNALQAQINPHFLYNTLEMIYWEAESADQTHIAEMVISLSKLFRLSLNKGNNYTSLAKEKEFIENYLILQKMRFKDDLNYSIQIEDNILNYTVLKLILQPFVENAILHGFGKKRGKVTISILGMRKADHLYFKIEDDGIGIDPLTLQNILEDETENETENETNASQESGGYAIKNINKRLQLYFKDNYSLKFNSELGKGTLVEILIPFNDQIKKEN